MAFEMMGRLMGPMNGDDDFVEITPGYGKDICAKLKAVRDETAKKYGVDYKSKDCEVMDSCTGPCAACEAEADMLYQLTKDMKPV